MAADGVVVGLGLDAPAVITRVEPIGERRTKRCQQPIGDFARPGRGLFRSFGNDVPRRRPPCEARPSGGRRPGAPRAPLPRVKGAEALSFAL